MYHKDLVDIYTKNKWMSEDDMFEFGNDENDEDDSDTVENMIYLRNENEQLKEKIKYLEALLATQEKVTTTTTTTTTIKNKMPPIFDDSNENEQEDEPIVKKPKKKIKTQQKNTGNESNFTDTICGLLDN